jgi:predicted DNA-binding transcriptional regulator YafY
VTQRERLFKLKHWLNEGRCVSRDWALKELQVSRATLARDIQFLRDRMNAPVTWDVRQGGWRLDAGVALPGTQYELPGLYFTAQEIHALLTMQHLLAELDAGGLLAPQIEPLRQRLGKLLDSGTLPKAEVARRIRIQTVGARRLHLPHFQAVGSALLRRKRMAIAYQGRGSALRSEREVSPQRLIHYRDNWYLDAWCHLRQALRSFSVDALLAVQVLDRAATEVPDTELDAELGAGYGIFAGRSVQWARLRFSPERARWVAAETWHPQQRGQWDAQGHYLLELPFADPRELEMDVLRHLPHVQVLGPDSLRDAVRTKVMQGLPSLTP